MGCSGILLRRDLAIKYPFNGDRNLSGSEDYELWLRIASRFKVHTPQVTTCSLHSHEERSVIFNIEEETLVNRIELLIKYAFADKAVNKIYGMKKNIFVSHCLLYISLHLAIAKINRSSIRYLFKAIQSNPWTLIDKRFFGTIKTLVKRNILASFD